MTTTEPLSKFIEKVIVCYGPTPNSSLTSKQFSSLNSVFFSSLISIFNDTSDQLLDALVNLLPVILIRMDIDFNSRYRYQLVDNLIQLLFTSCYDFLKIAKSIYVNKTPVHTTLLNYLNDNKVDQSRWNNWVALPEDTSLDSLFSVESERVSYLKEQLEERDKRIKELSTQIKTCQDSFDKLINIREASKNK
jgi:hypothetical protein